MTLRELVDGLEKKSRDSYDGAKALADVLEEKKKSGKLKVGEESDWLDAINSNVTRAQEAAEDVAALKKLLG